MQKSKTGLNWGVPQLSFRATVCNVTEISLSLLFDYRPSSRSIDYQWEILNWDMGKSTIYVFQSLAHDDNWK